MPAFITQFIAALMSLTGSLSPFAAEMPAPHQGYVAIDSDQTARKDLSDTYKVVWDSPEVLTDTAIRVHFGKSHYSCTGVDWNVEETPRDITINVMEGRFPGASVACPKILEHVTIVAQLSSPIAGRTIVVPTWK